MEEPPSEIYDTTGVGQDITIDTIYVDPVLPTSGDTLFISITKPFRSGDIYELKTMGAYVNKSLAENRLDRIVVVPNPYVAAASWEQKLPPGIISGRGERKIGFINLPEKCTIRIYTARGYLVRILEHLTDITDGAAGTIALFVQSAYDTEVTPVFLNGDPFARRFYKAWKFNLAFEGSQDAVTHSTRTSR